MKKLVIFGTGDASELATYYFTRDCGREIAGYVVDKEYMKDSEFCGHPVLPFDQMVQTFPPVSHDAFVALGYSKLNDLRKDKFLQIKSFGYSLPSYVSPRATVLNDGCYGENCFILEDNTIQPFVVVGDNVTLWSGNHIGHHSVVGSHSFFASHIVVSGRVTIGESCFLGVNATIRDNVSIGSRTIVGAGVLILGDADPGGVYIGSATERSRVPSHRLRKI